jgi:hypothetical protein
MPSEETRAPSEGAAPPSAGESEPFAQARAEIPPEAPVADPGEEPVESSSPGEEKPKESDSERPPDEKAASKERKNRFEALLPGMIRRGIERSIEAGLSTFERSLETGRETTGAVREAFSEVKAPRDVANAVGKALSEAKLPRELASAVFNQIDDTKNDVLRIIAREFREFLEATDLAGELKSALTSLSFEVRTEIRFIPNEAGEGVKADVRARSRIKRNAPNSERPRRRRARKSAEPEPREDNDDEE